MATARNRKKNKFKVIQFEFFRGNAERELKINFLSFFPQFNERSASSVRDQYPNDPAFTDDVRHLALPARRNSGPESEALKMFGKKNKSKTNSKEEHSSHYSLRLERRKKSTQANNYSAEYLCKNSSSSESLDNLISSYKMKGRKGFSLDRNIQSFDVEAKPQSKPKRSSWFLRDKSRDKKEKFLKRSSLDFTVTYDTKQPEKPRTKAKTIQRQNAADYTGESSTTPHDEPAEPKKSGLSKFSIGKRFLKGEIGIRSFNYYLLKEGLKKNQGKQKQESITTKPRLKSKSEENIYEEIYFRSDLPTPKPRTPPALPPFNKQPSLPLKQKKPLTDDGNCMNCEICLQEAQLKSSSLCTLKNCDKCVTTGHRHTRLMTSSLSGSEGYAQVTRKHGKNTIYDFFQSQQEGQTVLQFQSYNPNNPNVYKIETTPVAFDYKSIEEQIYQMELNQQYARAVEQQKSFSGDGKIVGKTTNDSTRSSRHHQHHQMAQQANEFYTRPTFSYGSSDRQSSTTKRENQSMYKTDSSNSIRSDNSLNKVYNSKNSSQKSNQSTRSVPSNHNRDEPQIRQDMSDSSLGDSLFSSDANKRYFGSSESCRFNYECGRRRCSLENEKCSFSDTCRYECNLRNCDCSSSYFSSDFDDTNIYNSSGGNNNTGTRMIKSHHQQQPPECQTNRYAEDFIKHVSNVKRRSQNVPFDGNNALISTQQMMTASIYEVPKMNPKRLEVDQMGHENENSKTIGGQAADDAGIIDSGPVDDDKTKLAEKGRGKATGTVPKSSSSISSNDSKKKKKQAEHGGKTIRNHANEIESPPTAMRSDGDEKSPSTEKILTDEISSLNVDVKTVEQPKGDLPKDSTKERQKNVEADDDDEVFLDSHQRKAPKAVVAGNETKPVS